MLNPTHLKTLHEVLATGSFAEAATRLGYTPSAVSQQIAALERSSGVVLFERSGRSIRPTRAAHAVAERSSSILQSLDALEREVRMLGSSTSGGLCLGSYPTASALLLPEALAHLRRNHPGITVQLEEGEPEGLVAALAAGRLDIAVTHRYGDGSSPPARLAQVPLLEEGLFLLVGAEEQAGHGYRSLAHLRQATWIATRADAGAHRCLQQLCAEAGFSPRIGYRSDDVAVARGLVRAGLGVAIAPALEAHEEPGLVALPLPAGAPKRSTALLFRESQGSGLLLPLLRSFLSAAAGLAATPGVRLVGTAPPTPDGAPVLSGRADAPGLPATRRTAQPS